jgi:hypothetical protein
MELQHSADAEFPLTTFTTVGAAVHPVRREHNEQTLHDLLIDGVVAEQVESVADGSTLGSLTRFFRRFTRIPSPS